MNSSDFQAVRFCRVGAVAVVLVADNKLAVHTGNGSIQLTRAEAHWLGEKLGELLELGSRRAADAAVQTFGGHHGNS